MDAVTHAPSIPVAAADQVPGLAEALAGFPPVPSRWLDPSQAPDRH